jgi:hypothetical protein
MCYALNSFDSASDPAYATATDWQDGDNGGSGFTPWNFDSSYFWPTDGNWYPHENPHFHAVDDGLQGGTHYSNPHNNIGRAWAMGYAPINEDGEVRAGRGFAPLGIGDTINVIFDNPTRRRFYNGYIIRLNGGTGGMDGNICPANKMPCTPMAPQPKEKFGLARFEYFNYGEWNIYDAGGKVTTGVYDEDTAAGGALLSVTRTGAETYDVLLDPFGPAPSFSATGRTFAFPGVPIDWVEFVFFNPVTDTTPTVDELATDLYIKSIEIIRAAPPGLPGDFNADGKVDAADYVTWRKNNGTNNALPNDGGLGTPITSAHYELWKENFGDMAGSGGGAAVPEPTTWVCLAGLFAGGLLLRRRV